MWRAGRAAGWLADGMVRLADIVLACCRKASQGMRTHGRAHLASSGLECLPNCTLLPAAHLMLYLMVSLNSTQS